MSGRIKYMRHKNKKSLKNLKQFRKFRTRAKFYIFVLFREWLMEGVNKKVQNWFFPIVGLILLGGILNHEFTKEYVFENPKIAVVFEESIVNGEAQPTPSSVEQDGTLATPQKQTLGSSTSTHSTPVRASGVIEAKIREAFPEDPDNAVAIAKCESQLDPSRIGDTHMKYPSVGLYQINQTWHKYPTEQLQNPDENIRIAKEIKNRWGNWNAWSCYKFDYYKKYLASN